MQRSFVLVFAALLVAHVIVAVSPRLYPFVDMPNHLGIATVVRDYEVFEDYYDLDLFPRPNIVHAVFCSLPVFPDVEAANRVFWALHVAAFAAGVLLLIRSVRGSPWWSLLAFPLSYHFSVGWGFVGYVSALPLLFFILAASPAYYERPTLGRGLGLGLMIGGLFFMHALVLLVALALWSAALLISQRGLGRWQTWMPITPAVLLVVLWQASEHATGENVGHLSFLPYYYKTQYLPKLGGRLSVLTHDLTHVADPRLAWALLASLVLGLVPGLRRPRDAWRVVSSTRVCAVALLALGGAGACLVFPERLPGYHILYQRFSVLALVGALVLASRACRQVPMKYLAVVGVLIAGGHLWEVDRDFKRFDAATAAFTPEIFAEIPEGKTLGGAICEPGDAGRSALLHYLDYYIVWRKGVATTRVLDARSFAVSRKEREGGLPPYQEWVWAWVASEDFDPRAYDGLDYLLVQGGLPPGGEALVDGRPLVKTSGKWRLFGSVDHGRASHDG